MNKLLLLLLVGCTPPYDAKSNAERFCACRGGVVFYEDSEEFLTVRCNDYSYVTNGYRVVVLEQRCNTEEVHGTIHR